jgi:hypothetical protein
MNYVEARQRLEKSTALRLLKADSASLCLGFLNAVFRVDRAVWRPQSEMIARLNAFRLTEMLEWYPPPAGNWLLDVVGYLEIARAKGSRYLVRADAGHPWVYIPPGQTEAARLPQIYFYK